MFIKHKLPEVEEVKLKPLFGLRPGIIIVIFWALVILLALFLLCLFPSFVTNKAYVKFDVPLSSVAVYEDGEYLGNASTSFYRTTKGEHTYTFSYLSQNIGEAKVNIKKGHFFTLFHKKINEIKPLLNIDINLEEEVKKNFIEEIEIRSQILDYSTQYNFPPLYSNLAKDECVLDISDFSSLWLYGALHVTSSTLYSDYNKGKEILENNNINYKSDELDKVESFLSSLFGGETITYKSIENTSIMPLVRDGYYYYPEGTIELGSGGEISNQLDIEKMIVSSSYSDFELNGTVVTEYEYALFVSDNPMWAKSNKEELIALGFVDENYLEGITLSTLIKSKKPIRNISYYAALEYIEWLNSKEDKYIYSLPSESEWTRAALSTKSKKYVSTLSLIDKDTSTPSGMLGQVWEFTSTPYIPLMRVDNSIYNSVSSNSSDIIIKGGSYVNNDVDENSVGTIGRKTCSEFCGFRVKRNER